MATRADIGGRIAEKMEKMGDMKHAALAKQTGIDRSLLTRLINAKRRPNSDHIADIALALRVTPASLLPGGDERPWLPPPTALIVSDGRHPGGGFHVTAREQNIIAMFRSLSTDAERDELEGEIRRYWEIHTTGNSNPPPPAAPPKASPSRPL